MLRLIKRVQALLHDDMTKIGIYSSFSHIAQPLRKYPKIAPSNNMILLHSYIVLSTMQRLHGCQSP